MNLRYIRSNNHIKIVNHLKDIYNCYNKSFKDKLLGKLRFKDKYRFVYKDIIVMSDFFYTYHFNKFNKFNLYKDIIAHDLVSNTIEYSKDINLVFKIYNKFPVKYFHLICNKFLKSNKLSQKQLDILVQQLPQ